MTTKQGLERLKKKYNVQNGWQYGGGRRKLDDSDHFTIPTNHSNYYENVIRPIWVSEGFCDDDHVPRYKVKCLCDHPISENCFIYKQVGKTLHVRVIGNCCIKKFGLQGRKCQICNDVHRRSKHNICIPCESSLKKAEREKKRREMYCDCGRKKQKSSHGLCRSCYFGHPMWN